MKILKLLEARRNPTLNPKIDTLTTLKQLRDKMSTINGRMTNGFVTFTNHNKIGVRPDNSYLSPTAIYAYDIDYVISEWHDLPYAYDRKFLKVFSLSRPDKAFILGDNYPAQEVFQQIKNDDKWSAFFTSLTSPISDSRKFYTFVSVSVPKGKIGSFFNFIGYDAVIDLGGSSIDVEPRQTFVCNKSGIIEIDTVLNDRNFNNKELPGERRLDNEILHFLTSHETMSVLDFYSFLRQFAATFIFREHERLSANEVKAIVERNHKSVSFMMDDLSKRIENPALNEVYQKLKFLIERWYNSSMLICSDVFTNKLHKSDNPGQFFKENFPFLPDRQIRFLKYENFLRTKVVEEIYQQTSADILELRNDVSKLRATERRMWNDSI